MKKRIGALLRAALLAALLAALTAGIERFYFGFHHVDLSLPARTRGDGLTLLMQAQSALEPGGETLGWPLSQSGTASAPDALRRLFMRLCALLTRDPGRIVNLYLYAIPLLNVLAAYAVFRACGLRRLFAYPAALTFGFCPYVQHCVGAGHIALAAVECVPLVFLLCFWCAEDERFLRPGRGFLRYGRNLAAVLFAWMIAGNGMIEYPLFACVAFAVCALCLLLREGRKRDALAPAALAALVALFLLLDNASVSAAPVAPAAPTAPGEAMAYGLPIHSLLFSPHGYGVPALRSAFDWFANFASAQGRFYNENALSYMGVTAVAGFLAALVSAFSARAALREKGTPGARLWMLSCVMIALLLLSVQTGLGVLLSLLLPAVRHYDRAAPFIAFAGVLAAMLCAQALLTRFAASRARRAAVMCATLLLLGYGFVEQRKTYGYFEPGSTDELQLAYTLDEAFVDEIERLAGEDAMIFQLPYRPPEESEGAGGLWEDNPLRGPAHSGTLRWSYGAPAGSPNDVWYAQTAALPAQEMVQALRDAGFAGIWINRVAVPPDDAGADDAGADDAGADDASAQDGAALMDALLAAADCEEPLACANGHTFYIPLR